MTGPLVSAEKYTDSMMMKVFIEDKFHFTNWNWYSRMPDDDFKKIQDEIKKAYDHMESYGEVLPYKRGLNRVKRPWWKRIFSKVEYDLWFTYEITAGNYIAIYEGPLTVTERIA